MVLEERCWCKSTDLLATRTCMWPLTLKQSGRALNTQHKYLEHIGVVEDFLQYESIDLIARLEKRPETV